MSYRIRTEWMGSETQSLADLLKPGLKALCVGINPAPISVRAGHYYQGKLGRRVLSRLEAARVIPPGGGEWADEWAFSHGVGFTDIIKRPTESETDLRPEEFQYGKPLLLEKIETYRPRLVIFTFKKAARTLFGSFPGNGFRESLNIGESQTFVMPGPYESASSASETLATLRRRISQP